MLAWVSFRLILIRHWQHFDVDALVFSMKRRAHFGIFVGTLCRGEEAIMESF